MADPNAVADGSAVKTDPASTQPPAERVYAGKYKNPDELEKGYIELQKKIGQPKAPAPDGDTLKLGDVAVDEIPDTADVGAILERAGLKPEDVSKSFAETGKLSDEQYKAIKAKLGLPRAAVDQFLEGQQAQITVRAQAQQRIKTEAAAIVGGEAELTNLLANAKSFVPADEIEDINARLGDPKRFKGALRDVLEYRKASVGAGKSAPLVSGESSRSTGGEVFKTQQEMLNAMAESTKRYGNWSADADLLSRIAATQKVNPKITRAW
jgi:hypothetical protein